MPIYEYVCTGCKNELEILQSFSERPKRKCPKCGELKLKKIISMNAFHLKGGGWCKEGYDSTRKNEKSDKPDTDSKTKTSAEKKTGSKETKKKTTDKAPKSKAS